MDKSDKNDSTNIIIFPDYEKLKKDIESIRNELSKRIYKYDELVYVVCKNIETRYMMLIGALEYKYYQVHCDFLRTKRKMELIQMRINRQEKVDLDETEKILDEEFEEYTSKLEDYLGRMNDALDYLRGKTLSKEEREELKRLYYKIVKKLHPDMNPNITKEEGRLFNNAIEVYKNGDLEGLRMICEMLGEGEYQDILEDSISGLEKEKERLEKILKVVNDRINKIKSEYPYIVKEIIDSPEKTEEKKAKILTDIDKLKENIEIYNKRIEDILR